MSPITVAATITQAGLIFPVPIPLLSVKLYLLLVQTVGLKLLFLNLVVHDMDSFQLILKTDNELLLLVYTNKITNDLVFLCFKTTFIPCIPIRDAGYECIYKVSKDRLFIIFYSS